MSAIKFGQRQETTLCSLQVGLGYGINHIRKINRCQGWR